MKYTFPLIVFLTLPLFGIAQQTTGLFQYDWRTQEGYTLFTGLVDGHMQYLMNNCGEQVHSWNTPLSMPANSMYLLDDGSMLYPAIADTALNSPINVGGGGERIMKKDWDGNQTWDFIYYNDEVRLHHDIEPLPNGNVLALAWVMEDSLSAIAAGRRPTLISEGRLFSERVIEVEPTGPTSGNIVWEWDLWDHLIQELDPTRDNYGVVSDHPELLDINWNLLALDGDTGRADFVHLNSIDHNADLDQIVLSSQVYSEIWIIDHSTTTAQATGHTGGTFGKGGDFLYRYGNPQVYQHGTAQDQTLWRQHDANWVPNGYQDGGGIMIFNNGLNRVPGYSEIDIIDPPQSSPGTYTLTPGQAYGPTTKTWNFQATDQTDFYSYFISGARRLPNGNTMICEGESGHIFEVTDNGEVVWDYVSPIVNGSVLSSTDPIPVGQFPLNLVFRAEKYQPDFAGFIGKDLTPGAPLEADPIFSSCVVGSDDLNGTGTFSFYPNPTTGMVTLENLNGADLKVYDTTGQLVISQFINSNKFDVHLESRSVGLYAIDVELNGKRYVGKLMVQ